MPDVTTAAYSNSRTLISRFTARSSSAMGASISSSAVALDAIGANAAGWRSGLIDPHF